MKKSATKRSHAAGSARRPRTTARHADPSPAVAANDRYCDLLRAVLGPLRPPSPAGEAESDSGRRP